MKIKQDWGFGKASVNGFDGQEKPRGESLHSWRQHTVGLSKTLALFGAHFLYFLATLPRWSDTDYIRAKLFDISGCSAILTREIVNAL